MIELKLRRKKHTTKQTLGIMDIYKDNTFMFALATLELQWNNNKINDSCIPIGEYDIFHYNSSKYKNVFELLGTEPRTKILIHSGNYYTHTAGCILIGEIHDDINHDGFLDVVRSGNALNRLRRVCENEKIISIKIN